MSGCILVINLLSVTTPIPFYVCWGQVYSKFYDENDKNTIKHHIQGGQEVNPFQAGVHKATMNKQENMTNTKHQ